ncbi:MAG: hypothetical protein ABL899_00620 [Nitrospira sp.]
MKNKLISSKSTAVALGAVVFWMGAFGSVSADTFWAGSVSGDIYNANSGKVGVITQTPKTALDVSQDSGFGSFTPGYNGTVPINTPFLARTSINTPSSSFLHAALIGSNEVSLSGNLFRIELGLNAISLIKSTDIANYTTGSFLSGGNYMGRYEGSGKMPSVFGISAYSARGGAGNVDNMVGVEVGHTEDNGAIGGTTTNLFGVSVRTPDVKQASAGVTFTNIHGVHIADQKPVYGNTTNNPFGIYQEGSTNYNYFAGKVGLGTPTPTVALDVVGDVKSSNINAAGNVTAGSLGVTGTTTLASVNVSGSSSLNGSVNIGGNSNISGTLNVTATSTLAGIKVSGNIVSDGDICIGTCI